MEILLKFHIFDLPDYDLKFARLNIKFVCYEERLLYSGIN